MRGLLGPVLGSMAQDVWEPLAGSPGSPDDLLGEVYRSLSSRFQRYRSRADDREATEARALVEVRMAEATEDAERALVFLAELNSSDFFDEADAVSAVVGVADIFGDYDLPGLATTYVDLLRGFVARFSLRYYVDDGGGFWISWPGLATTLFQQVRDHAQATDATRDRFEDFELALAECIANPRTDKIETVLAKQMNLLEACGMCHPDTNARTLGAICDELHTWPHDKVRDVTKALYGFASDYPGVRHGGTYASAHRNLDLGDLAAFASALIGLSVYLTDGLREEIGAALTGRSKWVQPRSSPSLGPIGQIAGHA